MTTMKKVFLFFVLSVDSVFAQPSQDNGNKSSAFDYPNITVTVNNSPSPEYLFLGPADTVSGHLLILDNELIPLFYKKVTGQVYDFKQQPNGKLTYNIGPEYSYGMNSSGIRDKQYITPAEFALDVHDLQVMGDGSYYVFGRDYITIDMSQYVPGGDTAAILIAHTIHHMGADDNELWRWHSFDHYDVLDVDEAFDLTNHTIDWTHCNSIEVDPDNNLVISTRNFNEITKINRQTGEIIWRLGGERNQFQFINDIRGFGRQHDARVLSNGNLALFDNGNMLIPQYSSYVEYEIDEQNFTATLVRRYSRNGTIYSSVRGGVQELSNGNILISWDEIQNPFVSEISPEDSTVYEVKYDNYFHQYRAYKFPWRTNLFITEPTSIFFESISVGDSATMVINLISNSPEEIDITGFFNRDSSYIVEHSVPFILPPYGLEPIAIKFKPVDDGFFYDILHIRWDTETRRIAQTMVMTGRTDTIFAGVSDENNVREYKLAQNYPNPFNPSTNIEFQISDFGFVSLKVYDILGNEIATLVNEELFPGVYDIVFDLGTDLRSALTSGIYFYQLRTGNFMQTKKMLMLK